MTEPRQPTREQEIVLARERAKRTLPLIGFVLLGLIAITMPLPRRFVAALPLLVAAYLSVKLLRFLRDRPTREKLWTALSLGIIVSMLLTLVVQALFYGPVSAYEECIEQAHTSAARASCDQLSSGLLGSFLP
jgi:ABC-type iron transport system FetAB permease component